MANLIFHTGDERYEVVQFTMKNSIKVRRNFNSKRNKND